MARTRHWCCNLNLLVSYISNILKGKKKRGGGGLKFYAFTFLMDLNKSRKMDLSWRNCPNESNPIVSLYNRRTYEDSNCINSSHAIMGRQLKFQWPSNDSYAYYVYTYRWKKWIHKFSSHTDALLKAPATHSASSRAALSSAGKENLFTASSPISYLALCMQLPKDCRTIWSEYHVSISNNFL